MNPKNVIGGITTPVGVTMTDNDLNVIQIKYVSPVPIDGVSGGVPTIVFGNWNSK
ncbi:hypothetical protein D3C71_2184510 [compost metagenome]